MKESCACGHLPDFLYYDEAPKNFFRGLVTVEIDRDSWLELRKCHNCATLWVVDGWSWGAEEGRMAFRAKNETEWQEIATVEKRKELLLESRVGVTGEICIKAGCEERALAGVALCLDHYYELGWRR